MTDPQTTNSTSWLEGYHQALLDAAKMVEERFDFTGGEIEIADAIREMKDKGL